MKNILLTTAVLAALSLSANAQQRTVLYEEFTGENCGPCASANPGLEALMASNLDKAIHVTYMEPVPSTGYFYKSTIAVNDGRFHYYNAYWTSLGYSFTPSGMMDGHMPDSSGSGSSLSCGNIASFSQADIDNEYAVSSPFNITATHYYNDAQDSVYGQVVVTAVTDFGGHQLKLRAAFVKTMDFSHAPGSNGEKHFENVARNLFPSTSGQAIATAWTAGSSVTYYYRGKIAHLDTFTNTTTADSNFVIWIQNDSAGSMYKVQQAALSTMVPLGVAPVSSVAGNVTLYPNPAKDRATISLELQHTSEVSVKVLDQLGRTVYTIPAQSMMLGVQKLDITTGSLPAGIYSVVLDINGLQVVKRLSILKS